MTRNAVEAIRVLYVEDEETLRDVTSRFLETIGAYDVSCAENGQEGIEMAESWNPDFILMDVRMPVMSGPDAIRVLRSKPKTANIPIYVLTAYSDDKTLTTCQEAGADGYFPKPPNYQLVISTIREVLSQRSSTQ